MSGRRRDAALLAAGWLLLAAISGAFALRDLDRPGLYYDEAIQALPALALLEARPPPVVPGQSAHRLGNRWLPVMTQPYMGALKSQALVPGFALLGASPAVLRGTTWLWTLLGVGLAMWLARQLFDAPTALAAGALLALDPSLLWIGRHDWGSFALGFALRCGGLALLVSGWRDGARGRLAAAGLCLGLGVYNKLDFGVFLAAATLAFALAAPRRAIASLRDRPRRLAWLTAGLALGAAPMLMALPRTLAVGRRFAAASTAGASEWSEKLWTLRTLLDGSHFERLMRTGGVFPELAGVEGATASAFAWLLGAAVLWLLAALARAGAAGEREAALRFVLLAAVLVPLAVLATPRAIRIHHALNALPFPQLVVAAALGDLWRRGAARPALRGLAAAGLAVALVGHLSVVTATRAELERSGGRGRWSDRLDGFAAGLAAEPDTTVVTLDWGLALPLHFLAPEARVVETVWRLRDAERERRRLAMPGGPDVVYLLYPERFAVFDYARGFQESLARLPDDVVSVQTLRDGLGDPALLAVRIARPHRLVYRDALGVELQP